MHHTQPVRLLPYLHKLRQQLAQSGPDTLGEALSAPEMEHIFLEETGPHRQRIYPPLVTLRLFIDQILCSDRACLEAVNQHRLSRLMQGRARTSQSTGPYCKARQRLSLQLLERLCKYLGAQIECQVGVQWGWRGRCVKLFDATTVSMPDTAQNQQAWPQSGRQTPGLGFPLARIGALISLSSGAVLDYAVGAMQGKCSGEQALLRQVADSLADNDLLLADALHSTWWALHMLSSRGVPVLMPHDGKRSVDFTQGRIHSSTDHVAWWPRPLRASWMSRQEYAQLPQGIWVREIKLNDGRILVTTLLEPAQARVDELATLYAMRWNIEVDFRTLKADLNMDVLRCKSPAMVRKEIATYLLSYNLVRHIMTQAAQLAGEPARQLSFTGAQRLIRTFAGHQRRSEQSRQSELAQALLQDIARCLLPKRPHRIEPRAKKRRPKPLPLLKVPRWQAREQIRALRA